MRIAEIFRSIQGEGRLTGTWSDFVRTSGCNLRCWFCDTPYASSAADGEDLSVEEIVGQVERLEGLPSEMSAALRYVSPSETPPTASDGSPSEMSAPLRYASPSETPPTKTPPTVRHVVITGGEPMLFAELIPLAAALRRAGRHITIETSGTLYLPVECDLMSISPKLSNSRPTDRQDPRWMRRHERNRHAPEVIRRLVAEYDYQVKFVVDTPADCPEVEDYLIEFPKIDRARAMLMPQGTTVEELAEKARWLKPYCVEHGLAFCPRRQIEWFGQQRGT